MQEMEARVALVGLRRSIAAAVPFLSGVAVSLVLEEAQWGPGGGGCTEWAWWLEVRDPSYTDAPRDVASIGWSADGGVIVDVWVSVEWRRRGIATALWRAARQIDPRVLPVMRKVTEEGEAWLNAMAERDKEAEPPH